jgi:hypothetical protein
MKISEKVTLKEEINNLKHNKIIGDINIKNSTINFAGGGEHFIL